MLLQKVASYFPSEGVSFLSDTISLISFMPIGKPHKKPTIIQKQPFLLTLNIFEKKGYIKKETVVNASKSIIILMIKI